MFEPMKNQASTIARIATATATATDERLEAKRLGALFAIIFGVFLIWGTGYANAGLLHNAAHDARHAIGFPCH